MAKNFLWKVLGESIDLPFNVYDHPEKLCFDARGDLDLGRFCFDLKGNVRRRGMGLGGGAAAEVFVEVKNYEQGGSLLQEYEEFLRKATFLFSRPEHARTWFIFLATVPFGTSKGRQLCDGRWLRECRARWPTGGMAYEDGLEERVALIFATDSFRRLIESWTLTTNHGR